MKKKNLYRSRACRMVNFFDQALIDDWPTNSSIVWDMRPSYALSGTIWRASDKLLLEFSRASQLPTQKKDSPTCATVRDSTLLILHMVVISSHNNISCTMPSFIRAREDILLVFAFYILTPNRPSLVWNKFTRICQRNTFIIVETRLKKSQR